MSLRFRLVAVIAILLEAAIAAGGAIACLGARAQVRAKIHGAMAAAHDILHEAVGRWADQPQPEPAWCIVSTANVTSSPGDLTPTGGSLPVRSPWSATGARRGGFGL